MDRKLGEAARSVKLKAEKIMANSQRKALMKQILRQHSKGI